MSRKLTDELKNVLADRGIELVGITSTEPFVIRSAKERIVDPKDILPNARSVVIAGFSIKNIPDILPSEPGKPRGAFSSYGLRVFMPMRAYTQKMIAQFLRKNGFKSISTMKIPAKMAAVRAGLGTYGKNAVVLTDKFGSWVMFETLITDAPLECEDHPIETCTCDECDLCLRACPTQAFPAPFQLNRSLCITNWLWGTFVPPELREKQGNRLFGCGECLKACPKNNQFPTQLHYPVSLEKTDDCPELIPLLKADRDTFNKTISRFARWAGMDVIKGNAVIALGNSPDPAAIPALEQTLNHTKPQIRAYSAWALGRIGGNKARAILEKNLAKEPKPKVIQEIRSALSKA